MTHSKSSMLISSKQPGGGRDRDGEPDEEATAPATDRPVAQEPARGTEDRARRDQGRQHDRGQAAEGEEGVEGQTLVAGPQVLGVVRPAGHLVAGVVVVVCVADPQLVCGSPTAARSPGRLVDPPRARPSPD